MMPTLERIQDQQGTIEQLKEWAKIWPEGGSMVLFVAGAFAPSDRPKPRNNPNIPLSNGTLGYWEVLRVAIEWDDEGFSTPMEFVEALACEVEGTYSHYLVTRIMDGAEKEIEEVDQWVEPEGNVHAFS